PAPKPRSRRKKAEPAAEAVPAEIVEVAPEPVAEKPKRTRRKKAEPAAETATEIDAAPAAEPEASVPEAPAPESPAQPEPEPTAASPEAAPEAGTDEPAPAPRRGWWERAFGDGQEPIPPSAVLRRRGIEKPASDRPAHAEETLHPGCGRAAKAPQQQCALAAPAFNERGHQQFG